MSIATHEIRMIFNNVYKNQKNFLTPHVELYLQQTIKNVLFLFEISSGKFVNSKIYGITILKKEGSYYKKMTDLHYCDTNSRKSVEQIKQEAIKHVEDNYNEN